MFDCNSLHTPVVASKISSLVQDEGVAQLRLDEEVVPRVQHKWG